MRTLEAELIKELRKLPDRKKRYNFTLSESTKDAFAAWCNERGFKESTALDALIRKVIPKRYFCGVNKRGERV